MFYREVGTKYCILGKSHIDKVRQIAANMNLALWSLYIIETSPVTHFSIINALRFIFTLESYNPIRAIIPIWVLNQ